MRKSYKDQNKNYSDAFYSRFVWVTLIFVAPTEEQEGQSEEEQLKLKTKERARKEFLGAVASEGKESSYE